MKNIKYIAHRGNLEGKNFNLENVPSYIDRALDFGFDAEIDLRMVEDALYLGHDEPQYFINETWLKERSSKLWVHAKDINSAMWLAEKDWVQYFCHQSDEFTITNNGWLWCHAQKVELTSRCIIPLLSLDDIKKYNRVDFGGVCTDYVYEAFSKFK